MTMTYHCTVHALAAPCFSVTWDTFSNKSSTLVTHFSVTWVTVCSLKEQTGYQILQTVNPKPKTQNPKPKTQNPKPKQDTIYDSFTYRYEDEGNQGFSCFLALSDGTLRNLKKVEDLKKVNCVSACDNVCLCLCVCVCMCVCVCVCVCVHRITIESRKGRESLRYRHVCMYECIHICMYMCMNVSMYARVFVCVCVCVWVLLSGEMAGQGYAFGEDSLHLLQRQHRVSGVGTH
jgi:hypothetical protein